MFDKLDDLLIRFEEVLNELGEPGVTDNQEHFQKLMKEQSDLQPIVDAYREYKKNKETIQDSLSMLEEERPASIYFTVTFLLSYVPSVFGIESLEPAGNALMAVCYLVLAFQGLSLIEYLLRPRIRARAGRIAILAGVWILVGALLTWVGFVDNLIQIRKKVRYRGV